jgi:hypothetical protein
VRSASFEGTESTPPRVAECVRAKALAWRFTGFPLSGELDLLVTFTASTAPRL